MAEAIDLFIFRIRREKRETKKLIKLTKKFMKNYAEEDQKVVQSFVNVLVDFAAKLDEELNKI